MDTIRLLMWLLPLMPILLLLMGPEDALIKQMWRRQPLRMWHKETLVIAMALSMVIITAQHFWPAKDPALEWVGWAALLLAHGRNSVLMRLTEKQGRLAKQADPEAVKALVPCWRWANIYLYSAEFCWAMYFGWHHAWSGLAGVAVFLGYARWRAWHTKRQLE